MSDSGILDQNTALNSSPASTQSPPSSPPSSSSSLLAWSPLQSLRDPAPGEPALPLHGLLPHQRDSPRCAPARRVVYFVDNSVTAIAYAEGHVMRPSRVRVLHALVRSLGLDSEMTICQARPATEDEMSAYHRAAYLECLRRAPCICGDPFDPSALAFQKEFDVPFATRKGDCPLFPEVWALVASQAGASLACAEALIRGEATLALNWAGGMHHAAAAHASGFCFVNDIVLCIQRLLRHYQRVLYVDLDVHHGDGVEGAFYGNARVMTVSLHQFGNGFFPGTGDFHQSTQNGSFAINCPLPPRTGDAAYLLSFRTVLSSVVECFDPEVVVLQCGADTIAGDLIGRLCISTITHTQCVADILALGLPTVLLGGGGYHVFHTARCWAIHTATALGRTVAQMPTYIPRHDPYYMEYRKECAPRRPTLQVLLDPDVDQPLGLTESLVYWRQLCRSLHAQMHAARLVRQRFTRALSSAREQRARLLLRRQRSSSLTTTNSHAPRHTPSTTLGFTDSANARQLAAQKKPRLDS